MWNFINGKKTYLIAGVTIVYAWASVYLGLSDTATAIDLTLGALGMGTLRHGLSKS